MRPPPPTSTLFPYTTLFRSYVDMYKSIVVSCDTYYYTLASDIDIDIIARFIGQFGFGAKKRAMMSMSISLARDRKSTRLNSSHVAISYAVFCLKKKKKKKQT